MSDRKVQQLIEMRQQALRTDDTSDDVIAWNQCFLMALVFQKESEFHRFSRVLDDLITEIASGRNAFEAERIMKDI